MALRVKTLKEAIDEAERFLRVARQLDSTGRNVMFSGEHDWGQESASVKRASLDLTRTLAKLRKGE